MNFKKFGKRLSKINRLYEDVREDGEISSIELDLLLSYLKEAYEYAIETEAGDTEAPKRHDPIISKAEAPRRSKPEQAPKTHVIEQIAAEELHETTEHSDKIQVPITDSVSADTPSTDVPVETQEPEVNPIRVAPELVAAFELSTTTDLSDKLSMRKIADMTKSMGINERMFTVTELFGGDNELCSHVLGQINSFDNYDAAAKYLMTGIAKDQDWANPEKIKKAEKFIKLVQRRFV